MQISTILAFSIIVIGFVICPILLAVFFRYKKFNKIFAVVLLSCYLIVVVLGVFTEVKIGAEVVSINFTRSVEMFSKSADWTLSSIKLSDFIINIVILAPVGIIVTLFNFYKKGDKFWLGIRLLLVGFTLGFVIEFGQWILPIRRSVQLSDVLFNAFGCFFGGIWFMVLNLFSNKSK